jgi:hypothetical protein
MPAQFGADVRKDLEREQEIDIETRSPAGKARRTTIWVVVDADEVYVRSVDGPEGHWHRRILANPEAAVHVGSRSVPVRAIPVGDPDTVKRVSDGYLRKYASSEYAPTMVRDEILGTTLRLEPA